MKAELTWQGVLVVTADTDLESYALNKWCADNFKEGVFCGGNLRITLNPSAMALGETE